MPLLTCIHRLESELLPPPSATYCRMQMIALFLRYIFNIF